MHRSTQGVGVDSVVQRKTPSSESGSESTFSHLLVCAAIIASFEIIPSMAGVPQAAPPTFDPAGPLIFEHSVDVSIDCATLGAVIRYTTDGTDPTASSTLYSFPLTLTTSVTLKARSSKTGFDDSALTTGVYSYSVPSWTENFVRLSSGVPRQINIFDTIIGGFITVPADQDTLKVTVSNVMYADLLGNPTPLGVYDILASKNSIPSGTYPVTILIPDKGVLESGGNTALFVHPLAAGDYVLGAYSFYRGTKVVSYTLTAEFSPLPPVITSQPRDVIARGGESVRFAVEAKGESLQYQWFKDAVSMNGHRDPSLLIPNAEPKDSGGYRVVVSNAGGSITSRVASLTLESAGPIITRQPQDMIKRIGESATLAVEARGSNLEYQWSKDGVPINGERNSSLLIANSQLDDSGAYRVAVSNASGLVFSSVATLTVGIPPGISEITYHQVSGTGASVQFHVQAIGTPPLSYQWQFNSNSIPGAAGPDLLIRNVQQSAVGNYSVLVSNAFGSITGGPLWLGLPPAPPLELRILRQ
jgi:hypothetical protein